MSNCLQVGRRFNWLRVGRAVANLCGLVFQDGDGRNVDDKTQPLENRCNVSPSGAEPEELRARRSRKNIYDSLRQDRITTDLFPELTFPLDGNYYPKLVPLIAKKINRMVDQDLEFRVGALLSFLGLSLSSHLVGEVLKLRSDWEKSIRFFMWTKTQSNFEHSAQTYSLVLCTLARVNGLKPEDLETAFAVLQEMILKGLSPSVIAVNIVLDRLCKATKIKAALKVMGDSEGIGVKLDVVTYSTLIHGLGRARMFTEAFDMVETMEKRGIKVCLLTLNSVIYNFGNSGQWQQACKVFNGLSERNITPDAITYNSLIHGLCKSGQVNEALRVMKLMEEKGCQPEVVTYNSVIHGLATVNRLDDALSMFGIMKRSRCAPDVCTYNTLIGALKFRRRFAEMTDLLVEMRDVGCEPDWITRRIVKTIIFQLIDTQKQSMGDVESVPPPPR